MDVILHLAEALSHESGLSLDYQAIFVCFVGKFPLRTYRFPLSRRCRGFVCTGQFVTVQLISHGLKPRRFVLRTLYICYRLRGRLYVFRKSLGMHTLNSALLFFHSKSSSHHGHCVVHRPGCTLQHTPRPRPLLDYRKEHVLNLTLHP